MAASASTGGRARNAVVVGGGIAGLTAAIELRNCGWEVVVLERRPAPAEVDTGFSLWSFAIARLRALGLGEGLDRIGRPLERLVHRSWRGAPLTDIQLSELNAGLGAPSYEVRRAGLQGLLADELGQDAIRFGERCVAVLDSGRPVAILESGERVASDLLVGADGVGSAVRCHVAGDVRLTRDPVAIWRGVAQVGTELAPPGWHVRVMGPASLFGIGRLDERQVRWYAATRMAEQHASAGRQLKHQVEHLFGYWPSPVREVIGATEPDAVLLNDAPRARPLWRWLRGAAVLLGDAAHPTLPSLATGGGMAIEDAAALGECLRQHTDLEAALRDYERRRRRAAARIQRESILFAGVLALRRPLLVRARETLFRRSSRVQLHTIEHLSRGDGRWLAQARRPADPRSSPRSAKARRLGLRP